MTDTPNTAPNDGDGDQLRRKAIQRNIRRLLEQEGWSAKWVAEQLGLNPRSGAVLHWIHGRAIPSADKVIALAKLAGVSPADIDPHLPAAVKPSDVNKTTLGVLSRRLDRLEAVLSALLEEGLADRVTGLEETVAQLRERTDEHGDALSQLELEAQERSLDEDAERSDAETGQPPAERRASAGRRRSDHRQPPGRR